MNEEIKEMHFKVKIQNEDKIILIINVTEEIFIFSSLFLNFLHHSQKVTVIDIGRRILMKYHEICQNQLFS